MNKIGKPVYAIHLADVKVKSRGRNMVLPEMLITTGCAKEFHWNRLRAREGEGVHAEVEC